MSVKDDALPGLVPVDAGVELLEPMDLNNAMYAKCYKYTLEFLYATTHGRRS